MSRYTYIKIIILLTGALALLATVYYFFNDNNKKLMAKVDEATQPDELLWLVRAMNEELNQAESSVRAFALSQNPEHASLYSDLKKRIDQNNRLLNTHLKSDTLLYAYADSLSYLLNEKLNLYDELLAHTHERASDTTLTGLIGITAADSLAVSDSVSEQNPERLFKTNEQKQSFFKRLFAGDKKKQEELRKLIEKAEIEREQKHQALLKKAEASKQISEALNKQYLRLQELNNRELELVEKGKKLSVQINMLTDAIEKNRQEQNRLRVIQVRNEVFRSSLYMQWLVITGSAVILVLTLLLIRDIIKADRYRKELADSKRKAEEMAKARQQFLSTMSHEIRTPLTAISGYSNLLSRSELNIQQSRYLDFIRQSADHLLRMVNDILELSRLDSGTLTIEQIPFMPAVVAGEVCDLMRVKASEKDLILSCHVSAIQNVAVSGDPHKLRQILMNLIGNAIKFTQKGSVTLDCRKEVATDGRSLFKFIVRDTGIGIPEDKLQNLFNEFSQADETITRRFGGTGLGLSITHKLVGMHGGSIRVKSIEGMGSEFTVSIPYTCVEGIEMRGQEPAAPALKQTVSLAGIRILVADDVLINRLLQKEILEHAGADVQTAESGEAVIQYLKHNSAETDAVLMDLQMPGLSGIETASVIRHDLKLNTPLIATTANPITADSQALIRAGFNHILVKPFSEKELADCLHSLIPTDKIQQLAPNNLYDISELEKTSRGNRDFVHRMLKIFLFSADSMIRKLEKAIEENDYEMLGTTAHRLIPSCRQLSIDYMADRLEWMEEHSQLTVKPALTEWDARLKEIKSHFRLIQAKMENEFSSADTNQ